MRDTIRRLAGLTATFAITSTDNPATNPTRNFVPIASRDLLLVAPDGHKMPIHVAISAPYAEARFPTMKGSAACLVLTSANPDLAIEIPGADSMEALLAGLEFLQAFLQNLASAGGGTLTTADGASFDPGGSPLLQEFRALQARKTNPKKGPARGGAS